MDPETALGEAIRATSLTTEGMPTVNPHRDLIERRVNNLGSKPGWLWTTADIKPANASIAEQRVTRMSGNFIRLGLEPEAAINKAAEVVKKTSVTYNGVLLDLQNYQLPENFGEAMDAVVADFAERSPLMMERNYVEVGDISISPASSSGPSGGRFVLIDRETMLPLLDDKGRGAYVTLADLRGKSNEMQRERELTATRDAAFKSSTEGRGLVEAVDKDGKTYWVDKETREIYDFTYGEDAEAPTWKKTGRRYGRGVLVTPQGGPVLNDPNLGIGQSIGKGLSAVGNAIGNGLTAVGNALPEVKIGDEAFSDR